MRNIKTLNPLTGRYDYPPKKPPVASQCEAMRKKLNKISMAVTIEEVSRILAS